MTPIYCGILRLMLEYYEGEINREEIAQKLLDCTPKVYGNDNRKKKIYQTLKRFFQERNDHRTVDVYMEILEAEFSKEIFENLLDTCDKYNEHEKFITYIDSVILRKESVSTEEYDVLERFVKMNKEKFSDDEHENFNGILRNVKKRMHKFYDSNEEKLEKTKRQYQNTSFSKNLKSDEKDNEIYNLQKELEKKIDELFGTLDGEETKEEKSVS